MRLGTYAKGSADIERRDRGIPAIVDGRLWLSWQMCHNIDVAPIL